MFFQTVHLPVKHLKVMLTLGALFTTALFFAKPVLMLEVAIKFGAPALTLQFLKGAKAHCAVHSRNQDHILYCAHGHAVTGETSVR